MLERPASISKVEAHILQAAILQARSNFAYGNSWAHDGKPLADTLSGYLLKNRGVSG